MVVTKLLLEGSNTEGLLDLFCKKKNRSANYKSFTKWLENDLRYFFFNSAQFYWVNDSILKFLSVDAEKMRKYMPDGRHYKCSDSPWTLKHIIELVNKSCMETVVITVERSDDNLWATHVKYSHMTDDIQCIDDILKLAEMAEDNLFRLSGKVVYELMSENYFYQINRDKIPIEEKDKPNPKKLIETMRYLREERTHGDKSAALSADM